MSQPALKASRAEIREKNRIYDSASGDLWRLAVYEPVHGNREFANIGGRRVLDLIGEHAQLGQDSTAVEFCSGLGATCCYLAEKFGCQVTGIEFNEHQIRHARRRLSEMPTQTAKKVRFVRRDVRSWRTRRSFDLAYSLDSLALVEDTPQLLSNAYKALKPGGIIALAELTAGPRMSPELRKQLWEIDGFISLHSPRELASMMGEAGFRKVALADLTEDAVDCFEKISKALRDRREPILQVADENAYQSWVNMAKLYTGCFSERKLLYTKLTGVRVRNGPLGP